MPAPRPILKGLPSASVSSETVSNPFPFSSCPNIFDSPHVHFPPTPTLTSTAITHSPFMYDRAPIVVTPNTCALPERGGRKFVGSNSNQGLGYFHPHANFQVNNAVRDSVETVVVSPTIFSASVTVGTGNIQVNECGSLELFSMKKKRSPGPMLYDHDYDPFSFSSHDQQQHIQQTEHSLLFDNFSDSSGVFYTPPPCIPTPSSSSSSSSSISSSIPYSSRNVYETSTTASNNININTVYHSDKFQDKKKKSVDVGRKKRGKNQNRVEEECRTMLTRPGTPEVELEGCLGGF